MIALPTYDEIDGLVDTDPLKLRDLAWDLVREVQRLRSAGPAGRAAHPVGVDVSRLPAPVGPAPGAPRGQKLDAAGVAAIPPAASTAPEPPPPPSGQRPATPDYLTLARGQVPWGRIRGAIRHWYGTDSALYDKAGGRYGTSSTTLLREVVARMRTLDAESEYRRDGLADSLVHLADWHDQHPPAGERSGADELVAQLRATIADLDGHIARHAGKIAAPLIAASAKEVAAARHDLERAEERHTGLVAEFRRQIAALERRAARYRDWLRRHGIDPLTGVKVSDK